MPFPLIGNMLAQTSDIQHFEKGLSVTDLGSRECAAWNWETAKTITTMASSPIGIGLQLGDLVAKPLILEPARQTVRMLEDIQEIATGNGRTSGGNAATFHKAANTWNEVGRVAKENTEKMKATLREYNAILYPTCKPTPEARQFNQDFLSQSSHAPGGRLDSDAISNYSPSNK